MLKCEIVVGLLVGLLLCSCTMHTSKAKSKMATGVLIESGPPQGSPFDDSAGNQLGFTYVSSVITNNNPGPIKLHIDFTKQYDYPLGHTEKNFQVILLPEELTPDTATLINPYHDEILEFLGKENYAPNQLHKTLKAQESIVISIGTLRRRCTNCGVIPNVLFLENDEELFRNCDYFAIDDPSIETRLNLRLKLNFSDTCSIILCGEISNATQ